MLDDFDLAGIPDERTRTLIVRLLNLIEAQAADLRDAQGELQRLRDEINRSIIATTPPPEADGSPRRRPRVRR